MAGALSNPIIYGLPNRVVSPFGPGCRSHSVPQLHSTQHIIVGPHTIDASHHRNAGWTECFILAAEGGVEG